ncbi:DsbA family oxidoreductase [Lysobacter sp. KIS68-7]|uniref:DsbA family oxidoreductase n=1 Tax=Lysobacter sp. KIS68-7 TaxID=2904252 RepID=UPI001E348244|nr:DsbA family oxidoreductase [Lysobacter sp. KIS68-7]UHQ20043.1 DsbA family oxidoreductase [Lysobacter sp. KIS68-7]
MSDGGARNPARLAIGIHFDLICPWCFIGKRQLAEALRRFAEQAPAIAVESVWHPMQLLPDVPEQGLPFAEFYQRRLGSADAVQQRQQQVVAAAHRVGLSLDFARIRRMPNTARAHRLLRRVESLRQPALYDALLERLFAAYFQRGEDIGDAATLWTLAAEVGVPAVLRDDTTPAGASSPPGVAGVPHYAFNGQVTVSGAQDPGLLLMAMHKAAA